MVLIQLAVIAAAGVGIGVEQFRARRADRREHPGDDNQNGGPE